MDGASSTKQFLVDTKEVPNLLHCPASRFVSIGASQYLETACSRGGSSHLDGRHLCQFATILARNVLELLPGIEYWLVAEALHTIEIASTPACI
ncbi:hypothetical protein L917_02089 [Phytophthora nicotianae]|uniref:Uncharacterized protein n=1 Tax=Phytophthora nicotianae TaxID=4792 RepID=W2LV26_PHYNI|nr:hypothetical protein L917_02089 [Phytophthora nicotianae]